MVGKRAFNSGKDSPHEEAWPKDVESGPRSRPHFKDVVHEAIGRESTHQLKKQLIDSIDIEEFKKYKKSDEELKQLKDKKIKAYYERLNQRVDEYIEVDTIVEAMAEQIIDSMNPDIDHDGVIDHMGGLQNVNYRVEEMLPDEIQMQRRKDKKTSKRAINVNVAANVVLVAAKGFASLSSSSLSLIASLLDSALDLLCTGIILVTNRLVSWRVGSLKERFPVGRKRLEPIGILVFSVIMVISFAQILQESVQKLLPSGDHSMSELPLAAILAMGGTVLLKGIIGLFCMRIKTKQVEALVQDCKTDVYFNTLSLLFPLIGKHAGIWWLDPAGAAVLSLYVIFDWASTALENIARLCGCGVDSDLQRKLTFLAFRFSPLVRGFKSITAYHAGEGIWVEYDLLLDEKTPLRRVHDVGETLQYCAEALPEVDRCFVTVDCKLTNAPSTRKNN